METKVELLPIERCCVCDIWLFGLWSYHEGVVCSDKCLEEHNSSPLWELECCVVCSGLYIGECYHCVGV